ncbi:MAG: hypothetical protein ACJ8KC_11575 [Candidatus Udaeobacter sp.]
MVFKLGPNLTFHALLFARVVGRQKANSYAGCYGSLRDAAMCVQEVAGNKRDG